MRAIDNRTRTDWPKKSASVCARYVNLMPRNNIFIYLRNEVCSLIYFCHVIQLKVQNVCISKLHVFSFCTRYLWVLRDPTSRNGQKYVPQLQPRLGRSGGKNPERLTIVIVGVVSENS